MRFRHIWTARRNVLSLLVLLFICSAYLVQADQKNLGLTPHTALWSPLGEYAKSDRFQLRPNSLPPTNLTLADYYEAYKHAETLLRTGTTFRSMELQRLDPENCVATPNNPEACSFNVTSVQNNYLDFSDGRLYWRFCADYDEPFVGQGNVAQDKDDPGNQRTLDAYGFCPTWERLPADAQTRRVSNRLIYDGPGSGVADIRNKLVEARRIFSYLIVAQPTELRIGDLATDIPADQWTINPDGSVSRGKDGQADRVRDVGVGGLLETTREIANVHMIFGNDFMVKALRYPFGINDTSSEQVIRGEVLQLERASRQFDMVIDVLLYALNFNLGGSADMYMGEYFGPREIQLFSTASQRQVDVLTEIAKRERILEPDIATGNSVALGRLKQAYEEQYLQALALATLARSRAEDDPTTPDRDESRENFLDNGGWDIFSNLQRLTQQAQSIEAGLSPLGYDENAVPIQSFETLYNLVCGAPTSCQEAAGILDGALIAARDLKDDQRTFDTSYADLKNQLTALRNDYDTRLTEICGKSVKDIDGDGLKDFGFDECGPRFTKDRELDLQASSGLLAQNFMALAEAERSVALAEQRVQQSSEEIKSEQDRAGKVIKVTLRAGKEIGAAQLAAGVARAYQETRTVITSVGAEMYSGADATVAYETSLTVEASLNPIACIFGGCDATLESSISATFEASTGIRFAASRIDSTTGTWNPTEQQLAEYDSAITYAGTLRDAKIEEVNSAAKVKELLLEQANLVIEKQIAIEQLNQVLVEHNQIVNEYVLLQSQRQQAKAAIQESYLAKPYFRLLRDASALRASTTLDLATQGAYLTAKAFEYLTLRPVGYMNDLYRARNPSDLRLFMDRLASDYAALPKQQFSKRTYRLSLAKDILGLTDTYLNPDGKLTPQQVEQKRFEQFQVFLEENHYRTPSQGINKIAYAFSTSLDNPRFLGDVFNNRIAGVGDAQPGCAVGCDGLWLNLVTDQNVDDFEADLPQIKLTHGGTATYRDGSGREVRYMPGPAVMIGRTLPPGFGGKTSAAVMTTHVNLGLDQEPQGYQTDRFQDLSIATNAWVLEIDLVSPIENTKLDLSKIRDIEIRMDTTYVTPSTLAQSVVMDNQRVDAEVAGTAIPADVRAYLEKHSQELTPIRQDRSTSDATTPSQMTQHDGAVGTPYYGQAFVKEPINLGIMDIGFNLVINPDGSVAGSLCDNCALLHSTPTPLGGRYDAASRSLIIQTQPVEYIVGGRTVQRTLAFKGTFDENGADITGEYTDTLRGYGPKPIVTTGTFIVTRLATQVPLESGDAGISISPTALSIDGERVATNYSIVLDSKPTSPVTVTIMTDVKTVASPSSVTFTELNWNTAQVVSVSAVEGTNAGTSTITHRSSSEDTRYNDLRLPNISVTITDRDPTSRDNQVYTPLIRR